MCLIAFAWHAHPRYPLIIAANRDEFHARPTAPLQRWQENPDVIGGRDLREDGSWMALRRGGRLAAVTNVRDADLSQGKRSRGHLVRDFVLDNTLAAGFAEDAWLSGADYGGFNLLLHDGAELIWVSNRPKPMWKSITPGVHAVSNGAPSFVHGERPWPKVVLSMAGVKAWLRSIPDTVEPDTAPLFAMLANDRPVADHKLPDTGVGIETERMLAPPLIRGDTYGTRCSSVALIDTDGQATLTERRFGPGGAAIGNTRIVLPKP